MKREDVLAQLEALEEQVRQIVVIFLEGQNMPALDTLDDYKLVGNDFVGEMTLANGDRYEFIIGRTKTRLQKL